MSVTLRSPATPLAACAASGCSLAGARSLVLLAGVSTSIESRPTQPAARCAVIAFGHAGGTAFGHAGSAVASRRRFLARV